ncbi:hypothetical protein SRHO_G00304790, partial [Serrasalmus rhombeus]
PSPSKNVRLRETRKLHIKWIFANKEEKNIKYNHPVIDLVVFRRRTEERRAAAATPDRPSRILNRRKRFSKRPKG